MVDQQHHLTAIDVVVSNLARAVLYPPDTGHLAVLTGNGSEPRTRYDNPAFGKPFRTLLGRLEMLGLVRWHQSRRRHEASSLAPTEAFGERVRAAGITPDDFGRIEGEEVIVLARIDVKRLGNERVRHRKPVDYVDTAETLDMRSEMRALNAFLAEADISFIDDRNGPIDPHDRHMRRNFVIDGEDPLQQRFDRSGRLYGGFWQNLKRARRASIRIEGEPVSVLDYSAMFPRLAYAVAGVPPPVDDPYAIPGLEAHRRAVKLAMNTLLFDGHRHRKSWPEADDPGGDMPEEWAVSRFRKALLARHPALKDSFGIGLGHQLMNTESRIMIRLLMALKAKGLVALPLHDGVLVAGSRGDEVGRMMRQVAKEITGYDLPVA